MYICNLKILNVFVYGLKIITYILKNKDSLISTKRGKVGIIVTLVLFQFQNSVHFCVLFFIHHLENVISGVISFVTPKFHKGGL